MNPFPSKFYVSEKNINLPFTLSIRNNYVKLRITHIIVLSKYRETENISPNYHHNKELISITLRIRPEFIYLFADQKNNISEFVKSVIFLFL